MMMILNLLCEYLVKVYKYSYDVAWYAMNNDILYINCSNKAYADDIYRQIMLYCFDLGVTMDSVTGEDGAVLITLSTGEKIDFSYPF